MNAQQRRFENHAREIVAVIGLGLAVACSSGDAGPSGPQGPPDTGDPPVQLSVAATGRLERGMMVDIAASLNGQPVTSGVSWSATPSNAVEFPSPGKAVLKESGTVRIRATSGGAEGERTITVAAPPTIVFDMVSDGRREVLRSALDGRDRVRLSQGGTANDEPAVRQARVVYTRQPEGQLYSVPLGGGSPTPITQFGDVVRDASLSPNGQELAFTRTGGQAAPKIWISGSSGSGAERATPDIGFTGSTEGSPSWAPDGQRLVYMSTHQGPANLFILEVATRKVTPLLTDAFSSYVEPAWSPDGQWVAFASNKDGPTNLYRVRVETGEIERLTDRAGTDGQPAWLPDGRIVFTSWFGNETRMRWLDPAEPEKVYDIPLGDGDPRNPAGVF